MQRIVEALEAFESVSGVLLAELWEYIDPYSDRWEQS